MRQLTRALQRTAAPLGRRTVWVICSRLLQPTGRFRRRSLSLIVRPLDHAMRLPVLVAVIVGVSVSVTSCKHTPTTQAQTDWLYLGIPANEQYPDTKFRLDAKVPQAKYWRVSKIQHVSRDDYERDISAGRALFRDEHSGTQFYSTELRGDFVRHGDTRYWVTVLERKAYP
jgi:hypothetical protein